MEPGLVLAPAQAAVASRWHSGALLIWQVSSATAPYMGVVAVRVSHPAFDEPQNLQSQQDRGQLFLTQEVKK